MSVGNKQLTWAEYVPLALRTECPPEDALERLTQGLNADHIGGYKYVRLLHAYLGLSTEVGELNLEAGPYAFLKELGDVQWYLAIAWDANKFDGAPESGSGNLFSQGQQLQGGVRAMRTNVVRLEDGLKKFLFYGKEPSDVREILSAVNVYCDELCRYFRTTIEAVRAQNIEKLRARYPEKFDAELARGHDGN